VRIWRTSDCLGGSHCFADANSDERANRSRHRLPGGSARPNRNRPIAGRPGIPSVFTTFLGMTIPRLWHSSGIRVQGVKISPRARYCDAGSMLKRDEVRALEKPSVWIKSCCAAPADATPIEPCGKGSFQAVKLQRPVRATVCSHSTKGHGRCAFHQIQAG
jgi:hypothetical protein